MRSHDLRLRILTILGVGCVTACGGTVVVDPDGTTGTSTGGSGSGGSGVGTSVASSTNAASSSVVVGAGGSPGAPLVCAPAQDAPNPGIPENMGDQCFAPTELAMYIIGGPSPNLGASCEVGVLCPSSVSLYPYDASCQTYFVGEPYSVDGECCYAFNCGCCGRPFMVDGAARTATPERRSDWAGRAGTTPSAELRDAWLADALLEHASIASFSRFALQLLALGAPSDLVADAHRAALDEVAHAEACFALASRFASAPIGPGALPMEDAFGSVTLASAVAAAIEEGCVGETIAALVASEQLSVARDAEVRTALERIAADEARHAELAWRFVRWALGRDPSAAPAAREAFARAERLVEAAALADERSAPPADAASFADHGCLAPRTLAAAKRRALAEVISPCAEALLRA